MLKSLIDRIFPDKMRVEVENSSASTNNMNDQRLTGKFCDVKLRSGDGAEFHAHKSFLAARSNYFAEMFDSSFKEGKAEVIEMTGFDDQTLKIVLDYIYTGTIEMDFKNVMSVLHAFDLMRLANVVDVIDATLSYRAANCIEEVFAVATGPIVLPKTRKQVAETICMTREELKISKYMRKMNAEIMCEILKNEKCNKIFHHVLRWLKEKREDSDIQLVYEAIDLSILATSNLRSLLELGLSALKDKTNVVPIFRKSIDLILASRTGVVSLIVKNLSRFSEPVYSSLQVIGGLWWLIYVFLKKGETIQSDKFGICLICDNQDDKSIERFVSSISYTVKIPSKTRSLGYTCCWANVPFRQKPTPLFGYDFPAWISRKSLNDDANGYVTDDSVTIEVHVDIDHIDVKWRKF